MLYYIKTLRHLRYLCDTLCDTLSLLSQSNAILAILFQVKFARAREVMLNFVIIYFFIKVSKVSKVSQT